MGKSTAFDENVENETLLSMQSMGRDELLPAFFSRVNKRFNTPHVAILFTCGFMVCVILFLGIEDLVKTASSLMIILFILVNFCFVFNTTNE